MSKICMLKKNRATIRSMESIIEHLKMAILHTEKVLCEARGEKNKIKYGKKNDK